MVQFEEQLEQAMRTKWRAYYMNYRGLKDRIEDIVSQKTPSNAEFMRYLKAQCVKVVQFYEQSEDRLRALVRDLASQKPSDPNELEEASRRIQKEIDALRNYAKLNSEGMRKIAKKYDKNCGQTKTMQEDILETMKNSFITNADERLDEVSKTVQQMLQKATAETFGDEEDFAVAAIDSVGTGAEQPMLMKRSISRRRSFHDVGKMLMRRTPSTQQQAEVERQLIDVFEKHEWTTDETPTHDEKPSGAMRRLSLMLRAVFSAPVLVAVALTALTVTLWKYEVCEHLDGRSYFTIFVTLQSLYMLVLQHPPDVILLFATLVLRLFNVLNDKEAWGGFSNDVVLSVAVLGIVSAGVHRTGVVEYVLMQILGSPQGYPMALTRLCLPVFTLNVCISNTCVMGVLIPVIEKWSKEINLHPALFLMPMSYLMLISGTFAIFSTSSNLIAQGLLVSHKHEPFSSFEVAKLCVACTAAAFVYTAIAVPFLLSRYMRKPGESDDDVESSRGLGEKKCRRDMKFFVATMQITAPSLDGVKLVDSKLPPSIASGAGIVRWERMGASQSDISPDSVLRIYDVLYICCKQDTISTLLKERNVTFTALDAGWEFQHDSEHRAMVEVVLDGLCPLINQGLVKTNLFDEMYSANCIAVRPTSMQRYTENVENRKQVVVNFVKALRTQSEAAMHKLQVGDNLLLDVPRHFFEAYRDSPHFASVVLVKAPDKDKDEDGTPRTSTMEALSDAERQKRIKMIMSGGILVVMIILVASSTLTLLEASLLATFALVTTGCLPQQEALNAIKIRTILSIVGAFGIGEAMRKTSVAKVMAIMLCDAMMPFGRLGIYAALFGATVVLGIVFHAVAVVILMFNVCTELSSNPDLNMTLHRAVAVIMMGAGCQMLSPVSYQTNLMAFASGHYTFADFPKVGAGVALAVGVICVAFVDQLVD